MGGKKLESVTVAEDCQDGCLKMSEANASASARSFPRLFQKAHEFAQIGRTPKTGDRRISVRSLDIVLNPETAAVGSIRTPYVDAVAYAASDLFERAGIGFFGLGETFPVAGQNQGNAVALT